MREIVFLDIDTQNDFMRVKGALYVPGAQALIPNLKALTGVAAHNDILFWYLTQVPIYTLF